MGAKQSNNKLMNKPDVRTDHLRKARVDSRHKRIFFRRARLGSDHIQYTRSPEAGIHKHGR